MKNAMNRNENTFQLHAVTLESIYPLLPFARSAKSASNNTTTIMECDSCWVPDGQHGPAREKNKDEKRTWSKTGSSVARQKCYKLIALDTFNLSSVLKLV